MGAVYRATDTKLNRDVAIKILPDSFANDSDRLARFTREAQVLASLNHPNIAAIYGVEDRALILELVEGEDLKGPLPAATAIDYAHQIAEALEYAHEKGIIHRDLKPANIKVTPEGRVKLLDFGLAKALSGGTAGATGTADPASSPTLTMTATIAGVILGTAAYMSPEQAHGRDADRRADIWSFGVVLYEMLTGKSAFRGESISDTLASVLKLEPDWTALPPDTPASVRRMLRQCLKKDRRQRLQAIGDARIAIEDREPNETSAIPSPPRKSRNWLLATLSAAALAGAAVAVVHFREAPAEGPISRFGIAVPEKTRLSVGSRLAVSPDGRKLAFNADDADGHSRIWVRTLDSMDARPLAGTESASTAFWSPDSRWIGFWADGRIKKIDTAGSAPPQTVCMASESVSSGTWNRDGVILFGSFNALQPVQRVAQSGGKAVPLTVLDHDSHEAAHGFPQFLPDGRHYLYMALLADRAGYVVAYAATLDGKEKKRLLEADSQVLYVPPATKSGEGHLLFLREGTLMAEGFDANRLTLSGEPVSVVEHVWSYRTFGFFSASNNGLLVYRAGGTAKLDGQITWFDRAGTPVGSVGPRGSFDAIALSPDGSMVAASQFAVPTGRDLWLIDVARNVPTRFSFSPAINTSPVWSPDGTRVVFASRRDGPLNLYVKEAAGTKAEQPLLRSDLLQFPNDWSSDGRYLIYTQTDPVTKNDLWILPMTGEAKPEPFLKTAFNESQGQFSPGTTGQRWVAFISDESGPWQVYVEPFPAGPSAARIQVSAGLGGSQPRWRADGKELYYISEDNKLMAVDVKLSPSFQAGTPRPLLEAYVRGGAGFARAIFRYAVARDGKRFLINSDAIEPNSAGLTAVLNWEGALKK